MPKGLTLNAQRLEKKPSGGFKVKEIFIANRTVINPIETALSTYEVGEGKAKERVSITNDSVEKIFDNTKGVSKNNIETLQGFAKKVQSLNFYSQIIDKINNSNLPDENKFNLKRLVNKLKAQKNVVLN